MSEIGRERDARHGPLAAHAAGDAGAAAAELTEREVLLDWPSALEDSHAGRALVVTSANLIVRFAPRLRLGPRTALATRVAAIVRAIDATAKPELPARTNAVYVHLGGGTRADATASAAGWLAHVSGRGDALPVLESDPNVLGAHVAAALVAAQTWMRLLPLLPTTAGLAGETVYSLWEFGPASTRGPALGPVALPGVALLGGCGAVGQACANVLVSARTSGRLLAVDRGFVDDVTNLNRSFLATEADLEAHAPKVDLVKRSAADSSLLVDPLPHDIAAVIKDIEDRRLPWPAALLTAFDDGEPRRLAQLLWPDVVFDAATGDTMAQVFRSVFGTGACLRCLYRPQASRDYVSDIAAATGLDAARIASGLNDPSLTVDATDLAHLAPELRAVGREHLGRDICGLVAAVERYLGPRAAPTQLSVSFTSYLAGIFLAAEAIKWAAGFDSPMTGSYQIDPVARLDPPRPAPEDQLAGCACVERRETIDAYRAQMRAPVGARNLG